MTDVDTEICNARDAGKYVYISDMSGKAETFFEYGTNYLRYDFHGDVKKAIIKKSISKDEVAENLRTKIKHALKRGQLLVINCDTMVPAFKTDYNKPDKKVPLENLIFDRAAFTDGENYKAILKDGEDVDDHGNVGMFMMKPDFNIIILHNMSDMDCDDEIVQMLLDEIFHIEDFQKIYIEPTE